MAKGAVSLRCWLGHQWRESVLTTVWRSFRVGYFKQKIADEQANAVQAHDQLKQSHAAEIQAIKAKHADEVAEAELMGARRESLKSQETVAELERKLKASL